VVALGSGDPQSGLVGLVKARTGIAGLDEVTDGGLPRARTTLLCGGPGCGKTLMSLQFLVRGALDDAEPGVFVAFEESPAELAQNVASLGWDLGELQRRGLLAIDHVRIAESQIEETGEWDLDGLFIRLGSAIESVNAKRLVLDTVEVLFGALGNEALLRRELRRLFRWLNDRGVTSIVTGERGARTLTRHGLEEYVSDCVIVLDRRVRDQIYTRRLRVVKCRGSHHGPDEYPFLIDRAGFSVLAVSAMGLDHAASRERGSSGVAALDEMLDAGGFYRGTSVLLSGTAGRGRRRWRRGSWRPGASAASGGCCWRSRNRRRRSPATSTPSGSTCSATSMRVCCGSTRHARRRTGSRRIWRARGGPSMSSSRSMW